MLNVIVQYVYLKNNQLHVCEKEIENKLLKY